MASMVCSLPKLVLPVGAYRPHRGVSLSAGELINFKDEQQQVQLAKVHGTTVMELP